MNVKRQRHHRYLRRGSVLPLAVIFGVLVGIGIAALTVDVGLLCSARSQMQRTVDSSALAGASGVLSLNTNARAEEYAGLNDVSFHTMVPSDLVIEPGNWDGISRSFTPTPETGVDGRTPNSVRVTGTRAGLDLYFARFMGMNQTSTTRLATALVGSGRCIGVWGMENVTTNGGIITDSYDTTVGPYGPGNIRPNGDVCSCGDIVMHGSGSIRGDAMYGDGYNFLPSGGSYEVWGLVDEHGCEFPDPAVDYDAPQATNDNATIGLTSEGTSPWRGNPNEFNLAITGLETLTLQPGTYYFDSVRITGQAAIEIIGPTEIYIAGEATLTGGGLVNTTQIASNLKVFIEGPDATLTGDSIFYGSIVAPSCDLKTTGSFTGYGVILAKELTIGGDMIFHVDEQLAIDLFGGDVVRPVLVE
jgi:hypothetical protein